MRPNLSVTEVEIYLFLEILERCLIKLQGRGFLFSGASHQIIHGDCKVGQIFVSFGIMSQRDENVIAS
jgi:hypothetical protein